MPAAKYNSQQNTESIVSSKPLVSINHANFQESSSKCFLNSSAKKTYYKLIIHSIHYK